MIISLVFLGSDEIVSRIGTCLYDETSQISIPVETIQKEVSSLTNGAVLESKSIVSSWDIKSICSDHAKLTVNNFYVGFNSMYVVHFEYQYWNIYINKSYNPSTGVFTVSASIINEPNRDGNLGISFSVQPILIW